MQQQLKTTDLTGSPATITYEVSGEYIAASMDGPEECEEIEIISIIDETGADIFSESLGDLAVSVVERELRRHDERVRDDAMERILCAGRRD